MKTTLVTKRDQTQEPFDPQKIVNAVQRCLASLPEPTKNPEKLAAKIAAAVTRIAASKKKLDVERIQDLVEGQLLAADETEAWRRYKNYRDEHEKLRDLLDPKDAALVRDQKQYFPTELQHFQFTDKYSRFLDDKGRRETFPEAINRSLSFLKRHVGDKVDVSDAIWSELYVAMLKQEVFPSMRLFQMAGPALERCHVGAYNCAYVPIDRPTSWSELLYVMMAGAGCGFSVEAEYVEQLPRIKRQRSEPVTIHQIADTTEGWCEALRLGVEAWYGGFDMSFDFSRIRPQGARLKTKGGRASGPEPLRNLLAFARTKILSRQGKRLRPIDAHDIACFCGDAVQVGGTRRAAEISLSDLDDELMRKAKFGAFWYAEPQRQMANNSVVYDEQPPAIDFMAEWQSLAQSGSGERGIFNRAGAQRQIPARRKKANFGLNPCGEIYLRPRQFCNLSIAVARPNDTRETLLRKVYLAAILGTMQSTLTNFGYLPPEWQKNCEEERLLGVDINGQMDCPLLQPEMGYGTPSDGNSAERPQLLRDLKFMAVETNKEWAERLGIPVSTAVTCVKPSGNSSLLFNCSPGMHPRFAKHYIRRVRVEAFTPMAKLLVAEGVPHQVAPDGSYRFEFPMAAPDAIVTGDLSAVEQLQNWLDWKTDFTEHNPSITIYVKANEWLEVGNWVYEHWDKVGGLSFLPATDTIYQLAPYEAISEQKYLRCVAEFTKVDYAKLAYYEKTDQTSVAQDFACVAGVCEMP